MNEIQKSALTALIRRFAADADKLCASASRYTETEARSEYIDQLFDLLGWDMSNSTGLPNSLKDVVREESQVSETSAKRPDYTFRVGSKRKFFVEAKKPAVDIQTNKESAFQVRSYGWTAGMAVSILTNFRTLRVYDTSTAPKVGDSQDVGLLWEIGFEEFVEVFEDLEKRFGREPVGNGSLESFYGADSRGTIPINDVFLEKITTWRSRIATDIHTRNPEVDAEGLNDLSQKIINRLIFIRMCEDRGIEGEERLREIAKRKDFVEVRRLFRNLDVRYNTGLFEAAEDPFQNRLEIDSEVFLEIVEDLYFPQAPYSFSVLNADFLGQIYEVFLVKRLSIVDGNVELIDKPDYEDREVVTTPQPLVDELVRRAIQGKIRELGGVIDFDTILGMRVLDIAVGSGRFLLRALDELVDAVVDALLESGETEGRVVQRGENDYRLEFGLKRQLLENCLFGIDIDFNAVEVSRFSLVVKLLEDENAGSLPLGDSILPNLDSNLVWGNSVVGSGEVTGASTGLDWAASGLPNEFSVVVGNPPYMKTGEMKTKSAAEFAFYKTKYETPYKQFDKYFVFMEKGISCLNEGGWLGMVVPNKWMNIIAGKNLRGLLARDSWVSEIVDFGNELIFEGKSTYVCLLVLGARDAETFDYRHVDNFDEWLRSPSDPGMSLPSSMLRGYCEKPWVLPSDDNEAKVLLELTASGLLLSEIADVMNGIQTSADDVFAIKEGTARGNVIRFEKNEVTWEIEEKITKPYLMDSGRIQSFHRLEADALVIFPYTYDSTGAAHVLPLDQLQRDFPLAWKYFVDHQERLEKRDISPAPENGEFYKFGRHQALNTAFQRNKIIYSVNQTGDKYAWDGNGCGFASGGTAGEVAISNSRDGYALEFILALLNQNVSEFFLRKRGSPFRGGYYSRGSSVITDLPVPLLDTEAKKAAHDAIVDLTNQICDLEAGLGVGRSVERRKADREVLRNRIDGEFSVFWNFEGADKKIKLPGS